MIMKINLREIQFWKRLQIYKFQNGFIITDFVLFKNEMYKLIPLIFFDNVKSYYSEVY